MALWQFEVGLEANNTIGYAISDTELIDRINALLPRRDSWSEHLLCWGDENGDRVHVVINDQNKICEITARIDLRSPNKVFVKSLVKLAKECNANFNIQESQLVADEQELLRAIKGSDSYRFVADPKSFF